MNRPTVKALVVHSPYAQQIAAGSKTIEHRSWRTHHRGLLAVVAARRPESGADAGRAVCLVTLADCVNTGGEYEWVLADPVPLPAGRPIVIPGRLGLFDVTDLIPAWALDLAGPAVARLPALAAPVVQPAKRRPRRDPPGAMRIKAGYHTVYG